MIFIAQGVEGREIHLPMSTVYGEHSMSCSRVLKWHKHPTAQISPCDFHIFGESKKDIRERRFASNEDECERVKNWFGRITTSFFKLSMYKQFWRLLLR